MKASVPIVVQLFILSISILQTYLKRKGLLIGAEITGSAGTKITGHPAQNTSEVNKMISSALCPHELHFRYKKNMKCG